MNLVCYLNVIYMVVHEAWAAGFLAFYYNNILYKSLT